MNSEERVDRPFLVEVARIIEDAHTTGSGCLDCGPPGGACPRREWAAPILTEHRRRRAEAWQR